MWRVFVGDLNVGYHVASVQMPLLAKYTNDWQVLTGMLAGGLECTKGTGAIGLYRERNSRSGTEPVRNTTLLNSYHTALAQRKSTPYGEMGVRLSQASTL